MAARGSRSGSSLPVTPVHGIEVKNDDLVIGTHGRSFYVMDNIGVLRQVSRETTNEPVVLFDPVGRDPIGRRAAWPSTTT